NLFSSSDQFSKSSFTLFLDHVCVPRVLSKSYRFGGTEALENERIRICQFLSTFDKANRSRYFEEINEVTQRLLIRRGLRRIDESKIYVDEQGIRTAGDKLLREGFQRLKNFSNISGIQLLDTTKVILVK